MEMKFILMPFWKVKNLIGCKRDFNLVFLSVEKISLFFRVNVSRRKIYKMIILQMEF